MNDSQLSVMVAAGFEEVPLAAQMPVVHWLGATGVQVYLNFDVMPDLSVTRRQIEEAGLALRSIHAPFGAGCEISSPDAAERRAAVARLVASLDILADLGGAYAVVHPAAFSGKMKRRERERRRRLAAESLAVMVPEAEKRGLQLAVENMPPGWIGDTIKELIEIVETVSSPTVRICFDTGHANCVGRALKMWRQAEPYITTMHLHDNDGRTDQHREPFTGTIDWQGLRRTLARAHYEGDVVLECGEALLGLHRRGDTAWRDRFHQWWVGERL